MANKFLLLLFHSGQFHSVHCVKHQRRVFIRFSILFVLHVLHKYKGRDGPT